jgi:hypothetical protein
MTDLAIHVLTLISISKMELILLQQNVLRIAQSDIPLLQAPMNANNAQ